MLTLFVVGLSIFLTGAGTQSSTEVPQEVASANPPTDPDEYPIPDYVIDASDGKPCLLVTLNVTLQFKYKVGFGTEALTDDLILPEADSVNGSCEGNVTYLYTSWWDGRVVLNFTFVKQFDAVDDETVRGRWWASGVGLSFDTTNMTVLQASSTEGHVDFFKDDLQLFHTQLGMSFYCSSMTILTYKTSEMQVGVVFHPVHIQPFAVTGSVFHQAQECQKDLSVVRERAQKYLVPVIVACCLAAICVILVIGYAISRKINRYHDQSSYKPMD